MWQDRTGLAAYASGFSIGAEEGEALDFGVEGEFGEEDEDAGVAGARIEVEGEEELEVHPRDGPGFELGQVDADGREASEDSLQGAGPVGKGHHDGEFAGVGLDFELL